LSWLQETMLQHYVLQMSLQSMLNLVCAGFQKQLWNLTGQKIFTICFTCVTFTSDLAKIQKKSIAISLEVEMITVFSVLDASISG